MSALQEIIKYQKIHDEKVKKEIFEKKKSSDWIWCYFPIPKSIIVKGLSSEDTEKYALTESETMAFINNKGLYEKYCNMVQVVEYATFFNAMTTKEDDKRKFKESIFHFLHFSIDLLIYCNKKEKKSKNLVSHTTTERGEVFNKTYNEEIKEELKKKAENLIKICFKKKIELEKLEYTNLEYINEQWLHLEKQIYDITNTKISYKDQVKKFGKEAKDTTGDGSCFFWAILQTISKKPNDIGRDKVEQLRGHVIKTMLHNQKTLIGRNLSTEIENPHDNDIGNVYKDLKTGEVFSSFSSMEGRDDGYGRFVLNQEAAVAVAGDGGDVGNTQRMTWENYIKYMRKPRIYADVPVILGMSFFLKRKIYIIDMYDYTKNIIIDPIIFYNINKKRLIKSATDEININNVKYEWPKNKPIVIIRSGLHYNRTEKQVNEKYIDNFNVQILLNAIKNHKNEEEIYPEINNGLLEAVYKSVKNFGFGYTKEDIGKIILKSLSSEKKLNEINDVNMRIIRNILLDNSIKKSKSDLEKYKNNKKENTFTPDLGEPLITSNKCYGLRSTPYGWCAKLVGPCNGGKRGKKGGGKSKKRKKISRRKMIRKQSKRIRKQSKRIRKQSKRRKKKTKRNFIKF